MPNVVFDNYSFKATGGSAARTQPDREADVFNVKDYGALGNNSNDDTSAIQSAINAAVAASNPGATVFFPVGVYKTTSALTVNSTANVGLSFVGTGATLSAFNGSVISGNSSDYLLKTIHISTVANVLDPMVIETIKDLGFKNSFTRTTDLVDTETSGGAVYVGGGIGFSMRRCQVVTAGGIGFFSDGQNCVLAETNFVGGFGGTHAPRDIGVFIQNGKIENCKMNGNGISIVCAVNGTGVLIADNIDIEISGCGIAAGYSPIQFYDFVRNSLQPAGTYSIQTGRLTNVNMESVGDSDGLGLTSQMYFGNVTDFHVANCNWGSFGQVGTPKYGLNIQRANNCSFERLTAGGSPGFSIAAVNLVSVQGCRFSMCSMKSTQGVNWQGPTTVQPPGADGNFFEYCNSDGAMAIDTAAAATAFPLAPSTFGQTVVCSDSNDPAWTGTVSNVGKQLSAAATANSSTNPGGAVLNFASVPTWVSTAYKVLDVTNPNTALAGNNLVTAVTSNTVTISPATISSGSGGTGIANGDVIAFIHGGGSNKVLVRWVGTSSGNNGAWTIAG